LYAPPMKLVNVPKDFKGSASIYWRSLISAGRPRLISGFIKLLFQPAFIFTLFIIFDTEHFLKEKIVCNLNHFAAVFPYHNEHQINVDHPPAKILGQHFYAVAEVEGAPKGDKKARRYVADHRPGRQETDPDDGRGAYQKSPKSANADAPDFQHQHCDNDP